MQMLLIPDPRPLVDRLGADFFRQAPENPGIYLMRDAADKVLYVGKAKNLRKRLGSYRVANPDRMPRRHLRMLRAVVRIELRECADETAALAAESELLRALRPKFNRAGTWAGPPRFLAWRTGEQGLDFAIVPAVQDGWTCAGPMGAGAVHLRATLARQLWYAIHTGLGFGELPAGWFRTSRQELTNIPRRQADESLFQTAEASLRSFFTGDPDEFVGWLRERNAMRVHPFEVSIREEDLEALSEFAKRKPKINRGAAVDQVIIPAS